MEHRWSHQIHLANATGYKVRVLISPNKYWVIADLLVDVALIALDGYGVVASVNDLWSIWKAISFQKNAISMAWKLHNNLERHMLTVEPNQERDIYDRYMLNPLSYFTPSGWAALCGAPELTLTVFLIGPDDVIKMSQFNTNSDWSWIVHEDHVNRSKNGELWQDNGNVKNFVPSHK